MLVAFVPLLMAWALMTGAARAAGPSDQLARSAAASKSVQAPPTLNARRIQSSDWLLAMWKIAQLRAAPPEAPVVYLLGGSSARECTVSDAAWADEIASLGGPEVITVNLGSRNQTFGQDLQIVKNLPKSVPSIVLIGVNQGRYNLGQMDSRVTLPEATNPQPPGTQHHYSFKKIDSLATKKSLVGAWMKSAYPRFRARYAANFVALEQVVKKCKERGLHPVLVDLPRLTAVIGHAWDAPIGQYHKGCRTLTSMYQVPFYNFVQASGFVPKDFFDLVHLVEPGRPKFQEQLSTTTISLLKKYQMTPAPGS
jgi:hypothetical protein